jgi:hypothetical protein
MSDDEDNPKDPYLEDVIAGAIGPLTALLPAEELEALRRSLRDATAGDPGLAALYEAARPRAVPARSGDQPVDAEQPQPAEANVTPLRRTKGSAA